MFSALEWLREHLAGESTTDAVIPRWIAELILVETERITAKLTAAQNEARELRALMLKCHNVNTLYDETNDFDIYRPMPYASETLIGIIAQARAEREARNDFDESSDAVTGVGDR